MGMNSHNKRIVYFDAIKVLGIFLVCFYHFNSVDADFLRGADLAAYANYALGGVSVIAVPLFFMVNGALLLGRPYGFRQHAAKTVALYLLMWVWSLLLLVGLIPINGIPDSWVGFARDLFLMKIGTSNHLWFLQALISVYLLFPIMKHLHDLEDRRLLGWFAALVFVLSFGNNIINIIVNAAEYLLGAVFFEEDTEDFFRGLNPFGYHFYAFFYFIWGSLLSERIAGRGIKVSGLLLTAIALSSLLALASYGILMSHHVGRLYDTVWNGYPSIMALAMATSVFAILGKLRFGNESVNRVLTLIGSSTFGIYLIHMAVGAATSPLFRALPGSDNVLVNVIYGGFIVGSSFLIVSAMKRIPILRRLIVI